MYIATILFKKLIKNKNLFINFQTILRIVHYTG